MTVRFIGGDDNTSAIRGLLEGEGPFKLAVAFLGDYAAGIVEAAARRGKVQVICNLESGATNPEAIQRLLELEETLEGALKVRTCGSLHAKVYWTAVRAIVSSANLSANGLSYEDDELAGWLEAGVVVEDGATCRSIGTWFDALWSDDRVKKITSAMLAEAAELWNRRRAIRRPTARGSLLEAFRTSPQSFKDKPIYFVIWTELPDERDVAVAKQAVEGGHFLELHPGGWDLYTEWPDLPAGADLIEVRLSGNKGSSVELKRSFPKSREPFLKGPTGNTITVVQNISRIDHDTYQVPPPDRAIIRKAAKKLWEVAAGDDGGRVIALYEAREILAQAE